MENNSAAKMPMADLSAPVTTKQWFVMFLIGLVPFVNIVMLFYWAFAENVNVNKRGWARAAMLISLVVIALSLVFSAIVGAMLAAIFGSQDFQNEFTFDYSDPAFSQDYADALEALEGLEGIEGIEFVTE